MKCVKCGSENTRISNILMIDTLSILNLDEEGLDLNEIERVYTCNDCGKVFPRNKNIKLKSTK